MNLAYIDHHGAAHDLSRERCRSSPPALEATFAPGAEKISAVLLSRLDFDVQVVDLPPAARDLEGFLRLKLSSLYPASPSKTVFDYRREGRRPDGKRTAVLFLSTTETLQGVRDSAPEATLHLPYTLVRGKVRRLRAGRTVCTFFWLDWCEVLLFEGGGLVSSRAFGRPSSPGLFFEQRHRELPEEYRSAPHLLYCSERDEAMLKGVLPAVRPQVTEVVPVERAAGPFSPTGRGLFPVRPSFLTAHGWKVLGAAALVAASVFLLAAHGRARRLEAAYDAMQRRASRAERIEELLGREEALRESLSDLEALRPRSAFGFLDSLAEALAPEVRLQQCTLDEQGRFRLEGETDEAFRLLGRLERSPSFSELRLTRVQRDERTGRERFSLSGVYDETRR